MTDETVRALVLVAAGTNCDRETKRALSAAGAQPERIHVRNLVESPGQLKHYHFIVIPGGFSYGDDIGAGRIFANEIKFLIGEEFRSFVERGGLILGICNGFQVLVKSGLLPGLHPNTQEATLAENDSGRFETRWVHLKVTGNNSEFISNEEETLFLPVAHAEGKFIPASSAEKHDGAEPANGKNKRSVLQDLIDRDQIILKYTAPGNQKTEYPWNPNGSVANIAAISDTTGRILGMMPHPERFYSPYQHPRWTRENGSTSPDGLKLIKNGVNSAREVFIA